MNVELEAQQKRREIKQRKNQRKVITLFLSICDLLKQ
jgi:hypothetical protein